MSYKAVQTNVRRPGGFTINSSFQWSRSKIEVLVTKFIRNNAVTLPEMYEGRKTHNEILTEPICFLLFTIERF